MTRKKALRTLPVLALALCLAAPAVSLAQEPAASAAPVAQGQGAAQPIPSSLDLRQAVEYGLANNPTMLSARAQLLGSEYDQNSAMADFLPTATANYGVLNYDRQPRSSGINSGDQTTWTAQLNLSQPVFTGFKLLSTFQKAKLTK